MQMPSPSRPPRSLLPTRETRSPLAALVLAVSGGRTPWQMLRALASQDVPWQNVEIVQVDERIAPAGDPDRNLTHLQQSLLSHAPLRAEQIHAMPVNLPDPVAAAAQYATQLRQIAGAPPILDLIHLGLGPDGHTASLIPGDPVLEVTETDVASNRRLSGSTSNDIDLPNPESRPPHPLGRHRRRQSQRAARLQMADASIPAGRVDQQNAELLADRAAAAND